MKESSTVKYSFITIGFCLLFGAFYFYQNTQNFLKNTISTTGIVIDIERSAARSIKEKERRGAMRYSPVISFKTQNGKSIKFTSPVGSNRLNYIKGEVVEVLYQPSAPQNARINKFFSLWGVTTVLVTLSVVFFGIGYSIIFYKNRLEKKIDRLKKNGISIKALFHNVSINNSLAVDGKNPYQIIVQWQDANTSTLHSFKSENIWFDPTPYIKDEKITVLMENNNPKKYYVDISFLPESVG